MTPKTLAAAVLGHLTDLCEAVAWMVLGAGTYAYLHGGIPHGLFLLAGILGVIWVAATVAQRHTSPALTEPEDPS